MATITSNGTGGGAWSQGTTWQGGAVPADGDAVVIAAGDTVTVDVNLSSWTTGLTGITISGGATPGMLAFKNDAAGTYYLRIANNYNIVGTLNVNKGRLFMAGGTWASPSDLPFDRKHVIEFLGTGTGKIDLTNLDLIARCTEPVKKYVRTYASIFTVASVDPATDTIDLAPNTPPAVGTQVSVTSSGTLPGGLSENGIYYVRQVSGTTCKVAGQNDDATIIDITDAGTGTHKLYTGVPAGVTTLNVLEDVTSDAAWTTGASDGRAVLTSYDNDRQFVYLTAITATTITISAATDSTQYPGAWLTLASRNVRVLSNSTGSYSVPILTNGSGAYIQAELRNTSNTTSYTSAIIGGTGHIVNGAISSCWSGVYSGSGHTINGAISGCIIGLNSGTSHTINGAISGCLLGLSSGTSHTINGAISWCGNSVNEGTGHTISGAISGCSTGVSSGSGHTINSAISGCGTGVSSGSGHTINGAISGCIIGLNSGTSHTINGAISGCLLGLSSGTSHTINGAISGCGTGVSQSSCTLRGAQFSRNTQDIYYPYRITGYGATLGSTTQVTNYTKDYIGISTENGVWIYDHGRLLGRIKAWMPGGTIVTEAPPPNPPVTLDFAYKHTGADASLDVWVDIPFFAKGGSAATFTVYEICSAAPSTFTLGPRWQICDPSRPVGDDSAVLAQVTAQNDGGDDTLWHTLTLSYTPTADRILTLRCRGRDASKYWHWMFAVQQTGGGGGVIIPLPQLFGV